MKRFRGSLDYLKTSPLTQAPMRKYLDKLEEIYLFFQMTAQTKTFVPTLVIKQTDIMLALATELTQLNVAADAAQHSR